MKTYHSSYLRLLIHESFGREGHRFCIGAITWPCKQRIQLQWFPRNAPPTLAPDNCFFSFFYVYPPLLIAPCALVSSGCH